jgi:hypothetical protein
LEKTQTLTTVEETTPNLTYTVKVDSFPKNQRFIFGQRLADRSIRVLEILVDASYRFTGRAKLFVRESLLEGLRYPIP